MLVATLIVVIYIMKGLLATSILIGLVYIYIGVKDEIVDIRTTSRAERKRQAAQDDAFFDNLIEEQRKWEHTSQPLW